MSGVLAFRHHIDARHHNFPAKRSAELRSNRSSGALLFKRPFRLPYPKPVFSSSSMWRRERPAWKEDLEQASPSMQTPCNTSKNSSPSGVKRTIQPVSRRMILSTSNSNTGISRRSQTAPSEPKLKRLPQTAEEHPKRGYGQQLNIEPPGCPQGDPYRFLQQTDGAVNRFGVCHAKWNNPETRTCCRPH